MSTEGIYIQDNEGHVVPQRPPVSLPPQQHDVNVTPSEFGSTIKPKQNRRRCPSSSGSEGGDDVGGDGNTGVVNANDVSDVSTNLFSVDSSTKPQQNDPDPPPDVDEIIPSYKSYWKIGIALFLMSMTAASIASGTMPIIVPTCLVTGGFIIITKYLPVPMPTSPTLPLPLVPTRPTPLVDADLLQLLPVRLVLPVVAGLVVVLCLDIDIGSLSKPEVVDPPPEPESEAICDVATIYETMTATCVVTSSSNDKGSGGKEDECSCYKKMMKAQTDFKLTDMDDYSNYLTSK